MKKAVFALLATLLILSSCSVWNISCNRANLKNGYKYHEWELHGSNYMKNIPFNMDVALGYGGIIKEELRHGPGTRNPESEKSHSGDYGLKLGITPTYYFSDSRFQPFAAWGFNALFFEPRETKRTSSSVSYAIDTWLYMTPNAGARLFFSPKFGVHAKAGYSFGKVNHPDIPVKFTSGLIYSFGLTLTL